MGALMLILAAAKGGSGRDPRLVAAGADEGQGGDGLGESQNVCLTALGENGARKM